MSSDDSTIYEAVFYTIENPALVIDLNFVISDANAAAANFLGYASRADLIGTPVTDILIDPDLLERVADKILRNERWSGECELETKDNRVFFGVGSAVPIEIGGEISCIAGVFTNLTDRRKHTHSLRILNRILRHNIRNDINVVLGNVEQVDAAVDDPETKANLAKIRERLENIVGSADTARQLEYLLSDEKRTIVSTLSLGEVLIEVLAEVEDRYDASFFDYPDEFESVSIVANETVYRAVEKVLDNAVRHNTATEPYVRVSLDVGEDVVLTVADNGPGVHPSKRDMIFGREEVSQLHHGDGFSLFFVDQVMQTFGGEVWVEPSECGGAAFNLRFSRSK